MPYQYAAPDTAVHTTPPACPASCPTPLPSCSPWQLPSPVQGRTPTCPVRTAATAGMGPATQTTLLGPCTEAPAPKTELERTTKKDFDLHFYQSTQFPFSIVGGRPDATLLRAWAGWAQVDGQALGSTAAELAPCVALSYTFSCPPLPLLPSCIRCLKLPCFGRSCPTACSEEQGPARRGRQHAEHTL